MKQIFVAALVLCLSTVLPNVILGRFAPISSAQESKANPLAGDAYKKEPVYIRSDTVTLKGTERVFTYQGNVETKQGDFRVLSSELQGTYTEQNKIKELIATKNVTIRKADIVATSERAVYDAATGVVTLTENPELQQIGSVLTADIIKIFLDENRSTAEGTVRVKLKQEQK